MAKTHLAVVTCFMLFALLRPSLGCGAPPPPPPPPTTTTTTTAAPGPGTCGGVTCGVLGSSRSSFAQGLMSRGISPPPSPGSKIVNGQDIDIEQIPWQVGLANLNANHIFCGGSIINARWILSAAHCVEGKGPGSFRVIVGLTQKDTNWNAGTSYSVSAVHQHPEYDFPGLDIAVVQVSANINFVAHGARARPICWEDTPAKLAPKLVNENFWAIVSGWGRLHDGQPQPDHLQYAWLRTYKTSQCSLAQANPSVVCLDGHNTTKSVCFGDSGGPLSVQWDSKWQLLGATSFVTNKCAGLTGYATIDTTAVRDWIKGHAGSEC